MRQKAVTTCARDDAELVGNADFRVCCIADFPVGGVREGEASARQELMSS